MPRGWTGKDVTPFLLGWFNRETHGASLATNIAAGAFEPASLAAQVAVEYAAAG